MADTRPLDRLRAALNARTILPVLALIAIAITIFLVASTQPNRDMDAPAQSPPQAARALGGQASVAGAGVIEPASEVIDIGADVSGVVAALFVTPGQQVTRGQPLFTLDARQVRASAGEADAAIMLARARIASAQAGLRTAEAQLALYQDVGDKRAVSQLEVNERRGVADQARTQLAQAQAELRSAEASRTSTATQLSRYTVRAPMAAEVLQVNIRPGEFINSGGGGGNAASLVQIGNTRPLHVRVDIDENEIARAQLGRDAVISARGDAQRRTKVRFVRAEPLVVPKRSLTNAASERVDVRVLQIIYALPVDERRYFVGQQVDAFLPAVTKGQR